MTLILSCLTDDYIVQVSDRRLTRVDGSGNVVSIADEASNKAVFLDNKWIIGFTGLSRLAGRQADTWLADELVQSSSLPINARLNAIADALPSAVAWAPRHARPTAFVGAGYARINGGDVRPTAFHISNFLDDSGAPSPLKPSFSIRINPLDRRKDFMVLEAGARLLSGHRRELHQIIRSARKRHAGPVEVARILADAIWRVAKHNRGVGDRLMICSLPRAAVDASVTSGDAFVSGGLSLNPNEAAFFYLGPETSELTQFGPTIVTPGAVITNIELRFGNDDHPPKPSKGIADIHYQGPGGTRTPSDSPCPCGSGNLYKGCHDKT